ncbi:marine proteobacterial sortase target protein [Shewanella sp. KT0246]|uniref:marine proteobacterial sortase target protein n=1 Tax=Shewanella sp. KT0246 TaxID=2815912 RepID=UPI001BBD1F94|nr:marine proteobacterial sortase target protein [Shewanella sp. KT0246]GIU53093.1 marine proteobacterial sortase target protein [Shewanella sp. KT0246]
MKRVTRYQVSESANNKRDNDKRENESIRRFNNIAAYGCSGLILVVLMILNVLFPVHAMSPNNTRMVEVEGQADSEKVTQGILRYQHNGQRFESLPLSTDVQMKVSGWTNRVSVKQTFTNDSTVWINGSYIFPLPHNGAVDQMRLIIGERVIEGDIQPKNVAKATFEKAKAQGKRASLVSQQRPNIFTTEVANLGPSETLTVEISYQEKLVYKEGEFSLRFPMTINPRYSPAIKGTGKASASESSLSNSFYESLSPSLPTSIFNFSNEFFIADNFDDSKEKESLTVSLSIELDAGFKVANIDSPYQQVSKTGANDKWQIEFVKQEKANKDFVLTWRADESVIESAQPLTAVFTQRGQTHATSLDTRSGQVKGIDEFKNMQTIGDSHQAHNNVEYGLVMLTPSFATDSGFLQEQLESKSEAQYERISQSHVPRELILVIDTSGSMSGGSLKQAKQAMLYALAGLTSQDKFNVIEFNHSVSQLSATSLLGTSSNIGKANHFVRGLEANGGTEIGKALSASLITNETVQNYKAVANYGDSTQESASAQNHLRQVIFITDGAVSNEHGLFQQIEAELGDSRLFTVGIGSAPNAYFMERAAMFGRGTYTYIGKTSEVKTKIAKLLAKIEKPVSTDIKLTYQDGTVPDYWPVQIPDLYQDEPLLVSFKSPSYNQQDLIVSGYSQGQFWQQQISRNNPKQAVGLDLIWANAQISAIEATQTRANLPRVKSQVEALGMKYHLVTSQTSLVAVDKTPVNPMAEFNQNLQVKRHLPDGWQRPQGVLPQTATSSRLNMLIGLSLLIIALLHGLWLKGYLPGQRLVLPKGGKLEAL